MNTEALQSPAASPMHTWGLTAFGLHLLANLFMLCDHLRGTSMIDAEWLGWIGRIAFPLFAFLLTEGFVHTRSRRRYCLRLLGAALLSEIPFDLMMTDVVFNPLCQNVVWSFLLGMGLLSLFARIGALHRPLVRLLLSATVLLCFYLLGFLLFVDYYGYGMLMIALFYFTRIDRSAQPRLGICLRMAVQLLVMYWINCEMIQGLMWEVTLFGLPVNVYKQGFALLALPFVWLYGGRQGQHSPVLRRAFYLIYPTHLLLFWILSRFF